MGVVGGERRYSCECEEDGGIHIVVDGGVSLLAAATARAEASLAKSRHKNLVPISQTRARVA